jgi:hypothetical protein
MSNRFYPNIRIKTNDYSPEPKSVYQSSLLNYFVFSKQRQPKASTQNPNNIHNAHKNMTTSPTPAPCNHTYISQNFYGKLPPLYFSPTSVTSQSQTLLERAYHYLKAHCHTRSPFEAREVQILRQELEVGMSRDRREHTQYYVLQIQDLRKRKAMEVYWRGIRGLLCMGMGGWIMGWRMMVVRMVRMVEVREFGRT